MREEAKRIVGGAANGIKYNDFCVVTAFFDVILKCLRGHWMLRIVH